MLFLNWSRSVVGSKSHGCADPIPSLWMKASFVDTSWYCTVNVWNFYDIFSVQLNIRFVHLKHTALIFIPHILLSVLTDGKLLTCRWTKGQRLKQRLVPCINYVQALDVSLSLPQNLCHNYRSPQTSWRPSGWRFCIGNEDLYHVKHPLRPFYGNFTILQNHSP